MNPDMDETDFYQGWAYELFDEQHNVVTKLVIGTRVWIGLYKVGPWIVRNGQTLENDRRQIRKIEYNGELKQWIAKNQN